MIYLTGDTHAEFKHRFNAENHELRPHVLHLMRGQIFEIDERNIPSYVNKCGLLTAEFWCEYFETSEEIPVAVSDEGPGKIDEDTMCS